MTAKTPLQEQFERASHAEMQRVMDDHAQKRRELDRIGRMRAAGQQDAAATALDDYKRRHAIVAIPHTDDPHDAVDPSDFGS